MKILGHFKRHKIAYGIITLGMLVLVFTFGIPGKRTYIGHMAIKTIGMEEVKETKEEKEKKIMYATEEEKASAEEESVVVKESSTSAYPSETAEPSEVTPKSEEKTPAEYKVAAEKQEVQKQEIPEFLLKPPKKSAFQEGLH